MLQPGTGTAKPTAEDFVTVHYTGWTTDGKMFDSSYARGAASTFPVNRVIKGWGEGVQLMVVGEKRRFWIPRGARLRRAGAAGRRACSSSTSSWSTSSRRREEPAARRRGGARRRAEDAVGPGLQGAASRQAGGAHPTKGSRVTVHYSGWTTDGKLFDSSLMRGQTASFGLTDVIEGWTEGLQLMVPGEKARFWIPERLAYKGQGNGPKGMLVFDVELISHR